MHKVSSTKVLAFRRNDATQSLAPSPLREPYAVERYPAVGGVRLIGYGPEGTAIVELTIARSLYRPGMLTSLQQWMMADGDQPPTRKKHDRKPRS